MRHLIATLLASLMLLLSGASFTASADHHGDRDRHHRTEMRKEAHKHDKKMRKRHEKEHRRHDKERHHRQSCGDLGHMVRHAARGASNVGVWRISDDTYLVKYMRGGHYYMQNIYPAGGRYGSPVRVYYEDDGYWYQHGNRRRRYRDSGASLCLYLDGRRSASWPLVPLVEINL